MKNNFNTLLKYILDNSVNIEYRKETINGLFRAILEPVISNQKFESCVLFKLDNMKDKKSIFKRLAFSGANLFSYCNSLSELNLENLQLSDIWQDTEFVVVLGQRYSAALIWNYSMANKPECAAVCLLYNSKVITDIAKTIADNSKSDLKEYIQKYVSERRENFIMNQSLQAIASMLNEKNEEIIVSENEKQHLVAEDDTLKTAGIVADKAKFIAHEIKNNLSIINLYSKIVEKRMETVSADEDTMTSLNNSLVNIVNASENVSSLISDLRCLSTPYIQEVNIRNLVFSTVSMCEEKANNAGVTIKVAKFNDCLISTDRTKFQCALTNLIFNAVEACHSGCKICIDCFIEPKEIRIFVKNNGDKIPNEIKHKIFDSDFTTKSKGNGLGLAICKQQMLMVGGNINLVHSNSVETLFEIVMKR